MPPKKIKKRMNNEEREELSIFDDYTPKEKYDDEDD